MRDHFLEQHLKLRLWSQVRLQCSLPSACRREARGGRQTVISYFLPSFSPLLPDNEWLFSCRWLWRGTAVLPNKRLWFGRQKKRGERYFLCWLATFAWMLRTNASLPSTSMTQRLGELMRQLHPMAVLYYEARRCVHVIILNHVTKYISEEQEWESWGDGREQNCKHKKNVCEHHTRLLPIHPLT